MSLGSALPGFLLRGGGTVGLRAAVTTAAVEVEGALFVAERKTNSHNIRQPSYLGLLLKNIQPQNTASRLHCSSSS